jgi:TolB-like protein
VRAIPLFALALCAGALASVPAAADPARVVILPVVVHSATADSGYVSRGLADMLSARLEQLGSVDVVRAEDPEGATSRLSKAVELGRSSGGDYVLFGSFTQFGDGASLDMRCASLHGGESPPRTIFIQSGTMGEIIPKLDELADKVARYVSGEAPETTAAAARAESGSISELRRRLEALERAVFPPLSEPAQAAEPAPEPGPES